MFGSYHGCRLARLLAVTIGVLQLTAAAAVAQDHLDRRPPAADAPVQSLAAAPASPHDPSPPLPGAEPAPATAPAAAPAPTTTAPAPPPPPPPPPAPAPTPAPPAPPPPAPAAPPAAPASRVQRSYEAAVPAPWRGAIAVRLEVIAGNTSWASPDGTIQVSQYHASAREDLLRSVIAHEFGHLIAFRYGSQRYNGAAPDGWPAYSDRPEEAWADCVAQVMTGIVDPSHGLPPCAGSSLSWTSSWLGEGPSAHRRTR